MFNDQRNYSTSAETSIRLDLLEDLLSKLSRSHGTDHTMLTVRLAAILDLIAAVANATGVDLAEPWVAASQDGSIGLDWRHEGRRLAITYDCRGGIEYFGEADKGTEVEGHVESETDVRQLAAWLAAGSGLSNSSR